MRYKEFIIDNYKAIDKIVINLNNNVIPLIGINESGKTSILQAILAFDRSKDNLLGGAHIDPKNKYLTTQKDCVIKAKLILEEDDFNEIGEKVHLNMDSAAYKLLERKVKNSELIEMQRVCDNGKLSEYGIEELENIGENEKKVRQIINSIVKLLPNILYFDDFSDRVPSEIIIPDNFLEDNKFSKGVKREWQEIINEIFARSLNEDLSLKKFLMLEDKDDQENFLNDVNQTLNKMIINEWQELKTRFSNEDDENLTLRLRYEKVNEGFQFKFKVSDSECAGKNRVFDISQRSKGFQWFFNFIMKLKFNPKYKINPENAIYLLDEPGSYLHSSAQTELLKKLCEIAEKNTIIYCTHSQYLLDPDVINIANIKIVSKDQGNIKIEDYGDVKNNKNMGAFSALNDALQLKYGLPQNQFKKVIITEGIVDYYFYKMFVLKDDDIAIIPGAGASNLEDLISIMIAYSDKFLVILDNDSAGRTAESKYTNHYGKIFNDNCYKYEGIGDKAASFELEDLLTDEFKNIIMGEVNIFEIKKALISLYFNSDAIKNVLRKMDRETENKINILKRKVAEHFSSKM